MASSTASVGEEEDEDGAEADKVPLCFLLTWCLGEFYFTLLSKRKCRYIALIALRCVGTLFGLAFFFGFCTGFGVFMFFAVGGSEVLSGGQRTGRLARPAPRTPHRYSLSIFSYVRISPNLCCLLSGRSPPSQMFLGSFLLTFKRYSTPKELMQRLVDRYLAAHSDATIQYRVLSLIRHWIEHYFDDFSMVGKRDGVASVMSC
jgi:hypothetical protein